MSAIDQTNAKLLGEQVLGTSAPAGLSGEHRIREIEYATSRIRLREFNSPTSARPR